MKSRITSAITVHPHLSRRQFLKVTGRLGLTAAGLALLDACQGQPAVTNSTSDALETTTIRLIHMPSIQEPRYV